MGAFSAAVHSALFVANIPVRRGVVEGERERGGVWLLLVFAQEMIDILLFPDVGNSISYGSEGRRGEEGRGVLGAVRTCSKF